MSRNAYNPDVDDRHEFPKLKQRFDEDPARFLQSGEDLAVARIHGLRDEELLKAYRAVARQILTGDTRSDILELLDERERELTGESIEPTPEPETADPVPATDGGQAVATKPDDVHPATEGLVAGEVLVLAYADRTDYIFPATPDAETPYLLRAFDAEGDERTDGALGLTYAEVERRVDGESPTPIAEIDVRAPRLAASNGGDS